MANKFKIGPLQSKWLKRLKKYPERQTTKVLGIEMGDGSYRACCLGEAGLVVGSCRFNDQCLTEFNSNDRFSLDLSFERIGLYSDVGEVTDGGNENLASLNDDGHHTWPEIAYLIEAAPELFFTKSV